MKDENERAQFLETVTMPLWKACLDDLIAQGVDYGKTYPTEYFEHWLRLKRTQLPQFGFAVSRISTALQASRGMCLSCRGQKGKQYVILPAAANGHLGNNRMKRADREEYLANALLTKTNTATLSAEEKRRHESIKEKSEIRITWAARANKEIAKKIHELTP